MSFLFQNSPICPVFLSGNFLACSAGVLNLGSAFSVLLWALEGSFNLQMYVLQV